MPLEDLWVIHAKRSVVKCVLHVEPTWTELLLLQDDDVASREVFPDDASARSTALKLKQRLLGQGWRDAS